MKEIGRGLQANATHVQHAVHVYRIPGQQKSRRVPMHVRASRLRDGITPKAAVAFVSQPSGELLLRTPPTFLLCCRLSGRLRVVGRGVRMKRRAAKASGHLPFAECGFSPRTTAVLIKGD